MKNQAISGKTRICGIIGDPLAHTVSPSMHNAAFRFAGLDYVYVPFRVEKGGLGQAIQGIKALNIQGVNVTIPHKVQVIPFLEEIDALAENIGAVNTIVNSDGVLKGYNTDASGFWRSLLEEKIDTRGKKVVVLGAGGAARAVTFILSDKGADLTILNRHPESARKLADLISTTFRKPVQARELDRENLKKALSDAEIVVNTTSAGMSPGDEETPLPGELINSSMTVVDIIYNPLKTRLIADAEEQGARTIGGIEMLVRQGAAAFELWTGKQAPIEVMRDAAIEILGKP